MLAASLEMALAVLAPIGPATAVYAQQEKGLRWSDRSLTLAVRRSAGQGLGILSLPVPDLCAEVAIAAANRLAATPPATTRFLTGVFAPTGPPAAKATDLLRRMKRYITPGEAAAVRQPSSPSRAPPRSPAC